MLFQIITVDKGGVTGDKNHISLGNAIVYVPNAARNAEDHDDLLVIQELRLPYSVGTTGVHAYHHQHLPQVQPVGGLAIHRSEPRPPTNRIEPDKFDILHSK